MIENVNKTQKYFYRRKNFMKLSARNQLKGKVIDIKTGAVNSSARSFRRGIFPA